MSAPAVASITRRIEQAQVDRYAVAGRDPNPIHRETPEAYAGPFGRPAAHGMILLAMVSEAMAATFGLAWAESGTFKVRWRAPALPPVGVTASATLRKDVDGIATYDVAVEDEYGETLLTGTTTVRYA
jgi:3-hydroxybutyryl-CoA dehydratase